MTLDDFKNQLGRQDGLIKNLALLLNKWLLPEESSGPRNVPKKSNKYFTKVYWAKNKKFLITVLTIFAIMAVITLERLIYFSRMSMLSGFTPNLFYMVSRAAGKNILFLSIIIIMFVLRNSITFLRNKGLGRYLPLDNNIYLHKIIGVLIFILGMIHSLCHFSNFAIQAASAAACFFIETPQLICLARMLAAKAGLKVSGLRLTPSCCSFSLIFICLLWLKVKELADFP